jgi:hypothetical protein
VYRAGIILCLQVQEGKGEKEKRRRGEEEKKTAVGGKSEIRNPKYGGVGGPLCPFSPFPLFGHPEGWVVPSAPFPLCPFSLETF